MKPHEARFLSTGLPDSKVDEREQCSGSAPEAKVKWSTKSAGEYPKGWSFAFEEARLGESVEVLEAGSAAQLGRSTELGHPSA